MLSNASKTLDSLEADNWRLLYDCRWSPERRTELVPVLCHLLKDSDLGICKRAISAVGRIGHCNRRGALKKLIPAIAQFLDHDDELTRRMAVGTLIAVGADNPKIAVPALVRAAQREELLIPAMQALIEIGKPAKASTPLFVEKANHHQCKIRLLAIRGLDVVDASKSEAFPLLERALKDRCAEVRINAAKILTKKWPKHMTK
jgi:HEAT repeat protein